MKHLLSGIAVAALFAAMPALAQTSSTDQTKQPGMQGPSATSIMPEKGSAQSGSTTSSESMGKAHRGRHSARRGGLAPEDNMAEELNRQELQRVMQNSGEATGGGAASGTSTPTTGSGAPSNAGSPNTGSGATGTMKMQPGSNLTPGGTGAGGARPGTSSETGGTTNPAGGR